MPTPWWIRKLFNAPSTKTVKRAAKPRPGQLGMEQLEGRDLPSYTPTVTFGPTGTDATVTLLGIGDRATLLTDAGALTLKSDDGGFDTVRLAGPLTSLAVRSAGTGAGVRLAIDATVPRLTGGIAFAGAAGTDTLVGPGRDASWHLTGAGAGHIADPGFVRFSGVENLLGAADNQDTFYVGSGGSVAGAIAGGDGGFDTVVLTGRYSAVDYRVTGAQDGEIDLTENGATSTVRYFGMEPIEFTSDTSTFTFTGTLGNDSMTLRAITSQTGETMEISGAGETVRFPTPSAALVIRGLTGSDTITVESLPSNFAAKLQLYGNDNTTAAGVFADLAQTDTVTFAGSVSTRGGAIDVIADRIKVGAGVTLSALGAGAAGDITLRAQRLGLPDLANLAPALVLDNTVAIDIGAGATVTGGNVYLVARAEDVSRTSDLVPNKALSQVTVDYITGKLGALAPLPAQVLVKKTAATVTVGSGAAVTGTGAVTLSAKTGADASGTAGSKLFAVGYAGAGAESRVEVKSGATITAGGAAVLISTADATAKMEATNKQDLGGTGFAVGLAITNASVTSTVDVAAGAAVTAGTTANVYAGGALESGAKAKSGTFGNGAASLALGLGFSSADVAATVNGSITANGTAATAPDVYRDPDDVGNTDNALSGLANGVGVVATLKAKDKASAGAGLSNIDPPKDDEESSLFDQSLFDTLLDKLTEKHAENAKNANAGAATDLTSATGSSGGSALSLSGGVAFAQGAHTALADIGSTAVLKSKRDLTVKANIDESVQGSAESKAGPQKKNADGTDAGDSGSKASVAVNVAVLDNESKATVRPGAQLDALNATKVTATTNYGFLTKPAKLVPTSLAELNTAVKDKGFDAVNKYLDGSLGLKAALVNGWARSTASSDQIGVAGSVNVQVFTNDTAATVADGAKINQDAAWRAGAAPKQTVTVQADTNVALIDMAGIFSYKLPTGNANPLDAEFEFNLEFDPVASSGKKGGVGGAFYMTLLDNTTHATIGDGAEVWAAGADGVAVKANEAVFHVAFGQAGAKGGKFAVGGTVMYNQLTSDTLAQVSSTAHVTAPALTVAADSQVTQVSWAGGVVSGEGVGVGVGVAIDRIDRRTRALIGDPDAVGNGAVPQGTFIDVPGAVAVTATAGGRVWGATVAGALVSDASDKPDAAKGEKPGAPTLNGGSDPTKALSTPGAFKDVNKALPVPGGAPADAGGENGQSSGVGIAAAAAVNLISDTTVARIIDAGTLRAGAVTVAAANAMDHVALTGGAAFVLGSKENGTALAGGFSFSDLAQTTRAEVIDTDVRAGALTISAGRVGPVGAERGRDGAVGARVISATAGLAGTTASNGFTLGGSFALNRITSDTAAELRGSNVTLTGAATVTSGDTAEIIAVGGGLAFGGTAGVGASVGVNMLNTDTRAAVEDSTLSAGGDLTVKADTNSTIRAVGISAGAAKEVGVAVTLGVNLIGTPSDKNTTEAVIADTAVTRAGAVTVAARDDSNLQALGGAVGVGLQTAGFGAALGWNSVNTRVNAQLNGATLGSAQSPVGAVAVTARSSEDDGLANGKILSAAVGAAGSGPNGSFTLGGGLAFNQINSDVTARALIWAP